MANLTRRKLFAGGEFGIEIERFAEGHGEQRAHRHHHKRLFVLNGLLQRFQRGEKRNDRCAIIFFPVLQIQHAVFNDLLALSGGSGYPHGSFQQRTEKRRTMAAR